MKLEKVGMKKQRKVQIVRDEGRKGKHRSREEGKVYLYTVYRCNYRRHFKRNRKGVI